jgi:cold shock CspA family protein
MKNVKGVVRWFDNRSGEGMIRVGKKSIYTHWSAIAQGLNMDCSGERNAWCVLFKGQEVTVDVIEDSHFTQISKVY